MIKVNNLNKTFTNHGNSIHVIDNTSITLPDYGLITLLGESGSGKTTLLNVIGGLDKFDKGDINYPNYDARKYNMSKIDEYRNLNISYIFQNYYLLPNLSVYDNLAKSLEIIGIRDKDEIDKRIKICLTAVKMYKYRKKIVSNLSGGQQQRIAIARSLLKNSKLIIADEPTGNLDSENSINIMNILKEISKTRLVLLVTHNKNLAAHFSDFIYEINDGKIIKGYVPEKTDLILDSNTIYLGDLEKVEVKNENVDIDLFNSDEKIDLRLIRVGNTYYIDSSLPIKLLNETQLKVKNESRKEVKEEHNIDFDNSSFKDNYKKSFIKDFNKTLIRSFKEYHSSKKKIKVLRFTLFIIGIICSVLSILLFKTAIPNYSSIEVPTNAFEIRTSSFLKNYDTLSYDKVKKLLDDKEIESISYKQSYKFSLLMGKNYEFIKDNLVSSPILPLEFNSDPILYGSDTLTSSNDLIISKSLAEDISQGIPLNKLIDKNIYLSDGSANLILGTIKGITNSTNFEAFNKGLLYKENSSYINEDYYYNSGLCFYKNIDDLFNNEYKLVDGRLPENNNEILAFNGITDIPDSLFRSKKTIVGHLGYTYSDNITTDKIFVNESLADEYFEANFLNNYDRYYIKLKNNINNTGYNCFVNLYDAEKEAIDISTSSVKKAVFTPIIILYGIMIAYIYFTEHAKLMSQIKNIGILRAIGESRKNIAIKFASDSFVEALFSSAFGYLLVGVIFGSIDYLIRKLTEAKNQLFFEHPMYYVFLLLILLVFTFFGSLPSIMLTRRTPSDIIAKYDI